MTPGAARAAVSTAGGAVFAIRATDSSEPGAEIVRTADAPPPRDQPTRIERQPDPRPARPRPSGSSAHVSHGSSRRAWQIAETAGVFSAGAAAFAVVLEISACMDGPGIGFAENPVSFQLSGVFIAGAELALVARLSGARGYGWLVGLAASAAVVCAGVPQRLMEWSWARRCADGEAHACYAYAGVFAGALGGRRDENRERELYVRACELGDFGGCNRAVAVGAVTRPAACDFMRSACARSAPDDPWARANIDTRSFALSAPCSEARRCDEGEEVDGPASHPPR